MRKRKKGNPLLAKTMGIALIVVIALLPLLAWLGAFKTGSQQHLMDVQLVQLPPPPPAQKLHQAKRAHPHTVSHRGGHAHAGSTAKSVAVHVAAAAPSAGSSTGDNSIVNTNNTNVGLPPGPGTGSPKQPVLNPVLTTPTPAPVVTPKPVPTPTIAPTAPDQDAQVIPESQIKPVIPDDLLDADLDSTFKGLFTIHADGTVDVKTVNSTGKEELDQLALQAARQWKFRPAIRDGKPIDSFTRLEVEFVVG